MVELAEVVEESSVEAGVGGKVELSDVSCDVELVDTAVAMLDEGDVGLFDEESETCDAEEVVAPGYTV